jgi:hypothetical protein
MSDREYIVGRDMIVGAAHDYDELGDLMGADPAPRGDVYERGRPAAYARAPEGPRLVREKPRYARQFPIGFTRCQIPPGEVVDIEAKPQVLFRGERLAIAPSIARFFNVVDIKVGKNSQLAATGEMSGEAFSADAVGVRMELDTAQPGIVITLRVENTDNDVARDFKAVLYGTVLD